MQHILSLIGLFIFCGLKFLIGPISVLAYGLSHWETVFFCFFSGVFWAIFFYYLGVKIQVWWRTKFPSKKKKKTFSKINRRIIRFKNSFGPLGLAALIPVLSVPIAALLCSKYFKHDRHVIASFIASVAFWSITLTFLSNPVVAYFEILFT